MGNETEIGKEAGMSEIEDLAADAARIIAEHVDEKRALMQTLIVWNGGVVELAPWEFLGSVYR